MQYTNGNVPSIKNSQAISQSEIQRAMQNMNSTSGQSMVLGANLTSNTNMMTNSSSQSNMTNSVPSLNSSTSVGSGELQNVKNKVQNSGNSSGMY